MVFCRVIMGNTELVHPGSEQFHPSSEDFDSGMDDFQNPSHYVIWNMNANSHIYPEYAISFKISSDAEGDDLRLNSFVINIVSNMHVASLVESFFIRLRLRLDLFRWLDCIAGHSRQET